MVWTPFLRSRRARSWRLRATARGLYFCDFEHGFERGSFSQNGGLELLLRLLFAMVTHDQIESTVDAAAFVTEWWEHVAGRRLPGEEGGWIVFAVEFWDQCLYFGVTEMSILDAVDDLVASPFLERRSLFVSDHCGQMGYVVRCVGSDLDQEFAEQLRSDLVHQSSVDSDSKGAGVVVGDGCVFAEVPKAPVRMSIGDWMQAREQGVIGEIPK